MGAQIVSRTVENLEVSVQIDTNLPIGCCHAQALSFPVVPFFAKGPFGSGGKEDRS